MAGYCSGPRTTMARLQVLNRNAWCCCFNPLGIEVRHIGLFQSWGLIINNPTCNQGIEDIISWVFFGGGMVLLTFSGFKCPGNSAKPVICISASTPKQSPWPRPQTPRTLKNTTEILDKMIIAVLASPLIL